MIRLALAIALSLLAECHDASAGQFHVLYSFCAQANCTDGQLPLSGLIADGEGNLYGTAAWGGSGGGVVFELVRGKQDNWRYQVLYNFCSQQNCIDGYGPATRLIMDTSGNLYGTTRGSTYPSLYPSTIFELSLDADHTHWTYTSLYGFCRSPRGGGSCGHGRFNGAISALTYAGQAAGAPYDGKSPLFGYGVERYPHGSVGFVYRYPPKKSGGHVEHILRTCACVLGEPVLGNNGTLYGARVTDNQGGPGVVFALDVTTGTEAVLHKFCEQPQCSDGSEPSGGPMLDPSGNLYGNAYGGSPTSYCQDARFEQCGIVYKLTPQNGQYEYSILHDLCGKPNCSDGANPTSGLIQDSAGTLYGATQDGGGATGLNQYGVGTVFEASDTLHALYRFCREANCSDGAFPNGPLLMDATGDLYGTTNEGGAHMNLPNVFGGTIFEITN